MIQISSQGDKVVLSGIGTFAARSLRWDDEGGGRMSVYDTWQQRYLVYRARVEILSDQSGQPLVGNGEPVVQTLEDKVTRQVQATRSTYLWAEENGDLRDNSWQWSYGNGMAKERNALVILRDGHLSAMGLNVDTPPQSTCVVVIFVNDKAVGYVVLEKGQYSAARRFTTPVAVKVGDRANFYTYLGGKAKHGTVNAEITE